MGRRLGKVRVYGWGMCKEKTRRKGEASFVEGNAYSIALEQCATT